MWFKLWLCSQKQSGSASCLPAPSLTFTTCEMGGTNKARACMLPETREDQTPEGILEGAGGTLNGDREDPHGLCTRYECDHLRALSSGSRVVYNLFI